jgi:hypothetical protein
MLAFGVVGGGALTLLCGATVACAANAVVHSSRRPLDEVMLRMRSAKFAQDLQ